ncbi:MAG: MFS transporter [Deltaproteobacteria bacterium]|nr:MFS transporter [Deltaproteobacteria bacterium]
MNPSHPQIKNIGETPAALWDQSFVFLNLSFFLVFSNIAFLYLYPLALEAMGIEHHMVGLVLGTFSVAAVISRPFLGKLVIQWGEFTVISLGLTMSLVASLGYILITEFGPAMLFIRVLHGLGFSAFISAGFSLAAKTAHPDVRGEAFSIIGVSLMGAIAFAPYLGELLIREWGFSAIYMVAAGSVILAGFTAFKATRFVHIPDRDSKKESVKYVQLLKDRSFVFLLVSTIIFSHCQATVPNFLALISHERGVPAGRFFLVSNIMAIIILLLTGKLLDRFGKLFFMRLSYPAFALGILLIPEMIDSPFHPAPAVIYGIGVALLFSTHNALAASHGSNIEKPAIMSLFTTVYDAGFVTGAIVSGWYAHMTSLDMLYWTCGTLGFIGFCMVVVLPIKEK